MAKTTEGAKITLNKMLHKIDSNIYGHFIEEVGECIHDGIWVDSSPLKTLPMSNDPCLPNVREDLLQASKALFGQKDKNAQTVLRWPGGCYSDTYHWQDGLGHRDVRPVIKNPHWGHGPFRFVKNEHGALGPDINHQFGTDEFMAFSQQIEANTYINVNYGSGTPQEAAQWVEYCNGAADSEWGAKRALHHPKPYRVKYWGIANEIWAVWENGNERWANNYAEKYLQFAKAMKQKDASIKLIACGLDPLCTNKVIFPWDANQWNEKLLSVIGDSVDYLSIHIYYPTTIAPTFVFSGSDQHVRNQKAFGAIMAAHLNLEDLIDRVWKNIVNVLGQDTQVRIALDEWNVWYYLKQAIKANWALMDGLFVATILQTLQKHADKVSMANFALLVNVVGLIRTDQQGIVKTPSYLAFQMIRQHSYSNYLSLGLECMTYKNARLNAIRSKVAPYLNVGATTSDDQSKLCLSVVNKHFSDAISASIDLSNQNGHSYQLDEVVTLSHDDPFAMNTPEHRDHVGITSRKEVADNNEVHVFPAHSLTILTYKSTIRPD